MPVTWDSPPEDSKQTEFLSDRTVNLVREAENALAIKPIDIKPQTLEEFVLTHFDCPKRAAYFLATAKHNNRLNDEPA